MLSNISKITYYKKNDDKITKTNPGISRNKFISFVIILTFFFRNKYVIIETNSKIYS